MPFFVREPIRRWLQRLDAALADTEQDVADLQTATTGLVPTSGQKAALAGTSGTPGSGNKYVTDADTRNTNKRTADAIYETSGPTTLTVGAVADGALGGRSGSTFVGYDIHTATPKTTLSTADELWSADSAASYVRKRSTVLGTMFPTITTADITAKLAPTSWWRADNTVQTGGLVDTIVDNGTLAKNFVQTGTPRCPTATDGNGNTYLAFDGANDYYTAGAVSDYNFMHNGSSYCIAVVLSRASAAIAIELLLGNGGSDSTLIGFDLHWAFSSSTLQGPSLNSGKGTGGTLMANVSDYSLNTGLQVFFVRCCGSNLAPAAAGGVTPTNVDYQITRSGILKAYCSRNYSAAYSSSNASNVLYLGRLATSSTRFNAARIYEVAVWNSSISDAQQDFYAAYAGRRYTIPGVL